MYLALFLPETFLSLFLDVRPVMLDETSDIARAKDGDPCKSPAICQKIQAGKPSHLQEKSALYLHGNNLSQSRVKWASS